MTIHDTREPEQCPPEAGRFFRRALVVLDDSRVPFLVGGAYAFAHYTGINRHTKDFDVFVRPSDVGRVMKAFAAAGYRAEMVFSHWLAKAYHCGHFVDIIFSSGNGMCLVDDDFFAHSRSGEVLGRGVHFMPPEEMIWQKAFIMERERFDGADVNHLLRARGPELDWDRLLARFDKNWRVLLSHLILFDFVYPSDHATIPASVLRMLLERLEREPKEATDELRCWGTLLSRTQYLADIENENFVDPRLAPDGPMTPEQVGRWTDAGR